MNKKLKRICPPKEGINELWYTHMKYFAVHKNHEVIIHVEIFAR
jgi:hypothetical protein